jgi:hypothetical protein
VTVSHNLVAHTSYSGISLGWGWGWASSCDLQMEPPYSTNSCRRGTTYSGGNQILANRVYDVMRDLVDGGPIYTLGGQVALDGVQPTVAGNVLSGAGACFQMIYHDEGSSYWQTHDNVVFDTGCRWLGVWLHTSHDDVISGNYTDDPSAPLLAGSNLTYTPPAALTWPTWQPAAAAIRAAAGPRHLVVPALINDMDDGPSYSSTPGHRQWYNMGHRGYGDLGDDVHYAVENGAAVQLPFTGTGITVYGEKQSDQGLLEVLLDGRSLGTVDTSGPSRRAAQPIFTSGRLRPGHHVIELVKRSGTYATIDAFEVKPHS